MKRFVLVTGTDTGVGKTTISVALLGAWARRGWRVRPYKPIETGLCERSVDSDASRLALAVGLQESQTAYLRFKLPVAPEAAAAAEGTRIDVDRLVEACRALPGDDVLIEGAGGLLVPIAPGFVVADLALALGAGLLLVGRTQLGTINHTLLTLAEARRRGLLVSGVILNRLRAESGPEEADTLQLIASHGGITPLGPFPWSEQQDGDTLATLAARHLPIEALFEQAFGTRQTACDRPQ